MIFAVQKEAFARLKYLTSGLKPEFYSELQNAMVEWDKLFDIYVDDLSQLQFIAPEYRRYHCTTDQIRSNLDKRIEAVPITQHRGYDERKIDRKSTLIIFY